jgi:hypothetical protein
MGYKTVLVLAVNLLTATFATKFRPGPCPKYIFVPQPTYALGACDHPSSSASVSVPPPLGCITKNVSIPLPVCNNNHQRFLLVSEDVLDIKITELKDPDGHPLVDSLRSSGFVPIHQVLQKTLREHGMFDPDIVNEDTDIILDISTSELNATYGWSGLPGQEMEVDGKVSSMRFGCNGYGPYEVYIVSCLDGHLWCLVGLADRSEERGRRLFSTAAGHLANPTSLLGMATSVVLEGARRLLRENSAFTKTTT